ncbi:MAG TPA: TPM domain-containing protein [Ignavibacteriaceae bacterium]|nr:TPM domain-containing protein [Ignavibacteriaceae bacterium]
MKTPLIYKFLNDDELLRISNRIKDEERKTAGEICVSIKESRSFRQRKKSVKKLAEEEFFKLGIDKTRDKTGILIFFLLEARQFQILADSGIDTKVPEKTWDEIKDEMQSQFNEGKFSEGIIHGISRVGKILSEFFPVKPDDTNELSNKVVLE